MTDQPLTRRRAPAWVRAMPSRDLHGILGRFDRQRVGQDLSDGQEWLYDAAVSELEYRHRAEGQVWKRCSCRYCIPPFPDDDL